MPLQWISRSSFYYALQGETAVSHALMQLIDRQFLETPFYGVQQMTWHLQNEGHAVNVKSIRRLMRLMYAIEFRRTWQPKAHPGFRIFSRGRNWFSLSVTR